MEVISKLHNYYLKNCKPLVFVGEKRLSSDKRCRMYFLDTTEENEKNNYRKLFQEYLFYYICNNDIISCSKKLINAVSDDEILEELLFQGKSVHDNHGIYPQSDLRRTGIYGELFNDFYLNIVKNEELLTTYDMRTTFKGDNIHGVDIVAFKKENDRLCLIFSESKFVSSISAASNNLKSDISGSANEKGHVTKEYINDYSCFLLNKQHSSINNKNEELFILNKINELNNCIFNEHITPIEAFNQLDIKIRFDFFAVYHDNNQVIDERKIFFDRIVDEFNNSIVKTGINNYDVEVIFIPTKNSSVTLKQEMETWN